MVRIVSMVCAVATLLATALPGSADVALSPVTCEAAPAGSPGVFPDDTAATACPGLPGGPDLLVLSGRYMSWLALQSPQGLRSFEDDLLDAMQPFGAGLLFYRLEHETVWVVRDGNVYVGHIVSMTGNDPVTLERKSAFVTVPSRVDRKASLHASLGEALDSLLSP